jgi:hypothetical protein
MIPYQYYQHGFVVGSYFCLARVCVVVVVVAAAVLAVEWYVGIMEISMFYFLDILENEKQNCIKKKSDQFSIFTYVRTQATGTHSSIRAERQKQIQNPSASNSLSVVRANVQAQYP